MSQIHGMSDSVYDALPDEAKTALAAAYAENARLKTQSMGPGLRIKATPKGCVQLRGIKGVSIQYGLNLYPSTFEAIFAHQDEIKAFIEANKANLSYR